MDISTTITGSWCSTLICGFEVQKHGIRQTDDGSRRNRRLDVPVPILSVLVFQAARDFLAVDRRPELTDILKEKMACCRIPANPAVFA